MQRQLEKIMMVYCCASVFSISSHASFERSAHLALPVAILLHNNEVKSTQLAFSSGLSFNWWAKGHNGWLFGPGLSLTTTLPSTRGNQMVSVRTYEFLAAMRMSAAYELFWSSHALMPFLSIGSLLGSLIVDKHVVNQQDMNADVIYGMEIASGLSYWINIFGFGLAYGLVASNVSLRHRAEISLQLAFDLNPAI